MNPKPGPPVVFIVCSAAVWIVVTLASIVTVIQSPAENLDLALGITLLWIALVTFAALAFLIEYVGRGPE